jgi:hypothetical protein
VACGVEEECAAAGEPDEAAALRAVAGCVALGREVAECAAAPRGAAGPGEAVAPRVVVAREAGRVGAAPWPAAEAEPVCTGITGGPGARSWC